MCAQMLLLLLQKRYKNEIGSKAVELYWGEGEEEVAEAEGRTDDTKNKERPNHKTESKWRIASSIFFCCCCITAHRDCHTKISSGTAQLLRNGSSISSVSFNSITLELVVVVVVNSSSTTSNEALNPKASRLRTRRQKKQLQSVRFQWQPQTAHYTLHYTRVSVSERCHV